MLVEHCFLEQRLMSIASMQRGQFGVMSLCETLSLPQCCARACCRALLHVSNIVTYRLLSLQSGCRDCPLSWQILRRACFLLVSLVIDAASDAPSTRCTLTAAQCSMLALHPVAACWCFMHCRTCLFRRRPPLCRGVACTCTRSVKRACLLHQCSF